MEGSPPRPGVRVVRLSQFPELGIDVAWHEAVALVLETIDRFVSTGKGTVPAVAGLTLSRDGTLGRLELASRRATPVAQLAENLRDLLGTAAAPPELEAHIGRWTASDAEAVDDVEQVRAALAYFERPDRAAVLRALGERADDAQTSESASKQLRALTERAREDAAHAQPAPSKKLSKRHRLPLRRAVQAGVTLAAAAALSVAVPYLWRTVGAAPGQPSYAQRAVEQVGSTIKSGVDSLLGSTVVEQPVSPPQAESKPAAAPARVARRRAPAPADAPVFVLSEAQLLESLAEVTEVLPEPPVSAGEEPVDADASVLFDDSDPSIESPILRRPALPSEPPSDVAEDEIGTLDLVIGTDGRVERVQLLSPANRYQERMLLSAVKAWVFAPAMKDGRPVRCRTRIRVTL